MQQQRYDQLPPADCNIWPLVTTLACDIRASPGVSHLHQQRFIRAPLPAHCSHQQQHQHHQHFPHLLDHHHQQQQLMRGQQDALPHFSHLPHLSPLFPIRSAPPLALPHEDLAPLDLSRGRGSNNNNNNHLIAIASPKAHAASPRHQNPTVYSPIPGSPLARSPLPDTPKILRSPHHSRSPLPDRLSPYQSWSPHSEGGSPLSRRSPCRKSQRDLLSPYPERGVLSERGSPSLPRNTSTERLRLPKNNSTERLSALNQSSPVSQDALPSYLETWNRLQGSAFSCKKSPSPLRSPLRSPHSSITPLLIENAAQKACVSCGFLAKPSSHRHGDESVTADLQRRSSNKRSSVSSNSSGIEESPPAKQRRPSVPGTNSILSNREKPYKSSAGSSNPRATITLTRRTKNHDSLVKTTNVINQPLCHTSVLPEGFSATSLLVPSPPPTLVVTEVRSLVTNDFKNNCESDAVIVSDTSSSPVTSIYRHLLTPQPKKTSPQIWSPLHLDLPVSPRTPSSPKRNPAVHSPHRISPHMTSPHGISPHMTSPHGISPQMTCSGNPGSSNSRLHQPTPLVLPTAPTECQSTSSKPEATITTDSTKYLSENPADLLFSPALKSPFSPVRFQFSPSGAPFSPSGAPFSPDNKTPPSSTRPPFSPGPIGRISCTIQRGSEIFHLSSESKLDSPKDTNVTEDTNTTSTTAGSSTSSSTSSTSSSTPSTSSQKGPGAPDRLHIDAAIKNPSIFNKWFENLEKFMLQALAQQNQQATQASPAKVTTVPVSTAMVSTPAGLRQLAPNNIAFIQTASGALVAGQNQLQVVNSTASKTVRDLLEQQRHSVQVQVVNNTNASQTVRLPVSQSQQPQAVKGFIDLTDDAGDEKAVKTLQPGTVLITTTGGSSVSGNQVVLQSLNQQIRPQNTVLVSAVPTSQLRGGQVIVQRSPVTIAPTNAVRATFSGPIAPLQIKHPAPLPAAPIQKTPSNVKKLPPPKPSLKISRVQQGIVLSWNMNLTNEYSDITNYQLYAYQEQSGPVFSSLWKRVGDVRALPLPMACTLTQFQEGNKYHFAVRAVDTHGRTGPFSLPNSIHLVANAES